MTNLDITPKTEIAKDAVEETPAEETLRIFGKRLVALMKHPEVNAAGEWGESSKKADLSIV